MGVGVGVGLGVGVGVGLGVPVGVGVGVGVDVGVGDGDAGGGVFVAVVDPLLPHPITTANSNPRLSAASTWVRILVASGESVWLICCGLRCGLSPFRFAAPERSSRFCRHQQTWFSCAAYPVKSPRLSIPPQPSQDTGNIYISGAWYCRPIQSVILELQNKKGADSSALSIF